jgi:hypothetical protein
MMERVPSFGLIEIIIIAIVAGLVLLIGAGVVAVVVTRRRRANSHEADLSKGAVASPRSSGAPKWIALIVIVLLAFLALPLCVVVGGLVVITPVRQTTDMEPGLQPEIHVVEQGEAIVTLPPTVTEPSGTSSQGEHVSETAQPPGAQPGEPALLSLNPFNPTTFVVFLGLAGLVLLLGAAVVAALGKGWKGTEESSEGSQLNGDSQKTGLSKERLRTVLLVLVFWIALSAFLVLDLIYQVSLYWQFVVMYMAFWLLVGALLATGRSLRDKLLILGLFVLVLGSVRFVDWNSRKPFLRKFYSLQEGMTAEEVDQIMSGYMKANGGGPPQSQDQYEFDEQGEIVTGWVTYRHTNEGWGDSDWGVVTFENGRVVHRRFLPD